MIPISSLRPDLDPGLKTVLERLLESRVHDRHACADDALRALAPYSAGELGSLRIRSALARDGAANARRGTR